MTTILTAAQFVARVQARYRAFFVFCPVCGCAWRTEADICDHNDDNDSRYASDSPCGNPSCDGTCDTCDRLYSEEAWEIIAYQEEDDYVRGLAEQERHDAMTRWANPTIDLFHCSDSWSVMDGDGGEPHDFDANDDQWLSYMSIDEGIALLDLFDIGGLFWVGSMAYTLMPQTNRWAVDDMQDVEVSELHNFVFAAETVISERQALLSPFYAASDRLRDKRGMITSNDIPF